MAKGRPYLFSDIRLAVLAFFVAFFLLMSSGRMASYDAGQQLSAATLLVTEHALGSAHPPSTAFWVQAPNGLYYEPHDPGAIALMLPAAWLGAKLDHAPKAEMFLNPPLIAKVAASLTYAVVYAIGCMFLFLLFADLYSRQQAFLIAFVFAAGTYFLPYAKATWDVAPCAAAMCAFLYYVHLMLRDGAGVRPFVVAGCWLGIVCSFRFSIAPALVLAVMFLAWRTRGALRHYIAMAIVSAIWLVPTFMYNAVRTGSILRPGTMSDYYMKGGLNSMNGDMLAGVYGLLLGPNRGLIIFSPVVLTLLLLPWVWRRMHDRQRMMSLAMLLGAAVYTLAISKMVRWGAFGWGARYLLPCLPILFLMVGPCLVWIAERSRIAAAVIIVAAITLNVAPATTNWHVIVSEYPGADQQDASSPYQLKGIWQGLWKGVRGEPLVFSKSNVEEALQDDGRRFPDFWTARLMERSTAGRVAGLGIIAILLATMAASLRRIVWSGRASAETGRNPLSPAG